MPRYQLEIGVTVLVGAVASAATFALYNTKTGKISLREDDDEQPELAGEKDPFDVTEPEDTIDGTPIDEERFWKLVCLV